MQPNPADTLAACALAWAQLQEADSQLARLARYLHPTAAMRADRDRWSGQRYQAIGVLNSNLRFQAVAA